MNGKTASEQFIAMLKENKAVKEFDTRVTLDGEKVVIESWAFYLPGTRDRRTLVLYRWRDGTAALFQPIEMSNNLEKGLAALHNLLTQVPVGV